MFVENSIWKKQQLFDLPTEAPSLGMFGGGGGGHGSHSRVI